MTNREKIKELLKEKGAITSSQITDHVGVSRQYVNLVMKQLIAEKEAIKIGGTRGAFYVSRAYAKKHPDVLPSTFRKRYTNKQLEEHLVLAEVEERFPRLRELPENIRSIFTFAFSEMFNNAIEHSRSKHIEVEIGVQDNTLTFLVEDFGVGVFRNIMKKKSLNSEIEAIQDLLKGKTTTMPKSHSGEGIFFTSKASDLFILDSFGYQMIVEPPRDNVEIKTSGFRKRGTKVIFEIKADSDLHLNDVFKKYTNLTPGSDYGFDKTEIRVKLYAMSGVHISRSQARRILAGLDKFRVILLDFDQVEVIGQAFADEIYRVFQHAHPDIEIQEENMSEGVQFMVERAKNEARRRAKTPKR